MILKNACRRAPLVVTAGLLGISVAGATGAAPLSFVPSAVVAAGTHVAAFTVADFNSDGTPDLAVASMSYHSNTLAVLLGHRTGAYTVAPGSPVKLGRPPAGVVPSDIDGDGKIDLVVSRWGEFYDEGPVEVSTMLGDGQGRLRPAGRPPLEFDHQYRPTVSDVNGDGKADLVALKDDRVAVRLGDGTGRFVPVAKSAFATGVKGASGVAVADFNADGRSDLVVAGKSKVAILLGTGAGRFAAARGVTSKSGSLVVADFNVDGKPDLAVAGKKLWILLGNGAGGFARAPGTPLSVKPGVMTTADLNGDGKTDLASSIEDRDSETTGSIMYRLGDGKGGFHRWTGSLLDRRLPFGTRALSASDVNVDGKADLVALGVMGSKYGDEIAEEGENRLAVLLQKPSVAPPTIVRGRTLQSSVDARLTTRGTITRLAADGDRVAALTTASGDTDYAPPSEGAPAECACPAANRVVVLRAFDRKTKTFKTRFHFPHHEALFTGEGTVDVALGGGTVVWITSTEDGNTQGWLDVYSAQLAGGPPKRIDGSSDARAEYADGDRWIGHLLGAGSLLAYNSWATVCDTLPPANVGCYPGAAWLRVRSQRLVRLVVARRVVAKSGPASYRLAAVGGGRMAVESLEGSITILAPSGRRIASVPVANGDLPRGIALDRTHLAVARWSRTLDLYNPATGAKQGSLPVGPASALDFVGVNARLALFREGGRLVLVRLRDGKLMAFPLPSRTAAHVVDARLTERGLFYAYNVKRSRNTGRIVFEPTAKLLRRF